MAVAKMDKEKEPRENAIVRTFREVRSEMKKVVAALAAVISVVLFSADALFATLLGLLQSAVQ